MNDEVNGEPVAGAPVLPDEEAFPEQGGAAEMLRFLLGYVMFAPSGHNVQPWLFYVDEDAGAVELYADPSRALPVLDPRHREMTMSCGAALFHLRCAARYFGLAPHVRTLPEPGTNPWLFARLSVGARGSPPTAEERRLFRAIPERHTTWLSFDPEAPPPGLAADLREAAAAEGAWLEPLDEARRVGLRRLLREADTRWARSGAFRDEMAGWLGGQSPGGGIPGYPADVGELVAYTGPFRSAVDPAAALAGQTAGLEERAPLVVVLGTSTGDGPADWLAAGQALDRVLLRAAADGLAAAYLSGPVQVEGLRSRLADLLRSRGLPQVVLGFGRAPVPRPSPRRPLAEVLLAGRPGPAAEGGGTLTDGGGGNA